MMKHLLVGMLLMAAMGCAAWPMQDAAPPTLPPPRLLTPTPIPALPIDLSTAQRILTRGYLMAGVRYDLEPWAFIDDKGNLSGLDVDLARELARRWLGDSQAVEFVQVRTDTAVSMVQQGQVDIAFPGLDWTRAAEQRVDFGPPYTVNGLAVLTYANTGLSTPEDVVSRTLTYLTWTNTADLLRAHFPPTLTLMPADHFDQALALLAARQVDGYADQRFRLERGRRRLLGTRIVADVAPAWWSPLYAENDPFFADLVTLTLEDLWRDGTMSALYARWLPDAPLPALILHSGDAPLPDLHTAPPTRSSRDTLSELRVTQVLTVAYAPERWPYSGLSRGQPTGFEVRLVQAMAESWLGSKEAAHFVPMAPEQARAALTRGEVHMAIGGIEMSRAAELELDFAFPHYDDGGSWLALATAPLLSLDALGERPFGVLTGTQEAKDAALWALRPPVLAYDSIETALLALRTEDIAAIFGPRQPLLAIAYSQTGYVVSDARWQARPIAIALPPGDSRFRDWVNWTLLALEESGRYGALFRVWFDDPQPPWPPFSGPSPQALVLTPP